MKKVYADEKSAQFAIIIELLRRIRLDLAIILVVFSVICIGVALK